FDESSAAARVLVPGGVRVGADPTEAARWSVAVVRVLRAVQPGRLPVRRGEQAALPLARRHVHRGDRGGRGSAGRPARPRGPLKIECGRVTAITAGGP